MDKKVVAKSGDTELVMQNSKTSETKPQKAGQPGPASSLETGKSGVNADGGPTSKGMAYDVQLHTEEHGLEVKRVKAESGDEAAQKVLAGCSYKNASIRGVTPATDPDANSLGGERDAAQMIANAENGGNIVNTLGTDANAEAVEKLGRADIEELKN